MDDLAVEVGVKPDMISLFREDPLFAVRCFFGPCIPAQYRLVGPHSQPLVARRSIENCFTNVTKATQTRKVKVVSKKCQTSLSQRLVSIKVLLYTMTFVLVAFFFAHVHLI